MMPVRTIGRFGTACDANFAVFTALAVIPLTIALGGTIDYAGELRAASAAQDAADAAALAAAQRLETGTVDEANRDAQFYGRSNLPPDLAYITLTQVIDQTAGTVTVTAKGSHSSSFLKLAKIDSIPFERVSKAAIKQKGYLNFQFLLDVSESMNIAASDDDRKKLQATTKASNNRPCAFACHEVELGWSTKSVYQMNQEAGSNKARLRIDVLRDAADSMIDTLLAKNNDAGTLLDVDIQTNGFSQLFEKGVGPTKDAVKLKASIRNFAVSNNHTSYSSALYGLSAILGQQGDGKSSATPKKVALMITDGVKDDNWNLGPIDPLMCDQIKSKGVDLAILEIKYVEDYDYQNYYRDRVASYYPKISPSLESCATKGLYYLASDSVDAQSKLLKLMEKLVTNKLRVAG
jgi:Flp pilus assembly protein TadG